MESGLVLHVHFSPRSCPWCGASDMLYSRKVCRTLPSTSSNESLTNIHAYTAYLPTRLYAIVYCIFLPSTMSYAYLPSKTAFAKQSCCKVQLALEWLWMPCRSRSWKLLLCCLFPSCSNRHPCPTWPDKQVPWGKSAGGSVLAAPPSRALSEPQKKGVGNAGKQFTTKKQLRHVEARPNKKEQDTQAHEHSNCLEHILEHVTYLLHVVMLMLQQAASTCVMCKKNIMPQQAAFANPFETLQIPFHFATRLFALYDSWKITISHEP